MIPRATMRLQFHKGFTFADAARLAPYFARLGISHVYASPITTARPGSMHGYDVIDAACVNPELGADHVGYFFCHAARGCGLAAGNCNESGAAAVMGVAMVERLERT